MEKMKVAVAEELEQQTGADPGAVTEEGLLRQTHTGEGDQWLQELTETGDQWLQGLTETGDQWLHGLTGTKMLNEGYGDTRELTRATNGIGVLAGRTRGTGERDCMLLTWGRCRG